MMPAGRRTKYVTLDNPGDPVADGAGGYTESWTPLDPPATWAALEPLGGDMEQLVADTIMASGTHTVTLPYHPGVTVQTRITYVDPDRGPRVFRVLGMRDPSEARRELVAVTAEALP
jgi:head-tail adaptor